MSKYRGPRSRIIRYLGALPALTQKIPNRKTRPGQHGRRRKKPTQFSYRLIEKQKLRFHYIVSEKQLLRYVKSARKATGPTGWILLQHLEIRLDNLIYRAGLTTTLAGARQLVNHGHILVNRKCVDIPSFNCFPGQVIRIRKNKVVDALAKRNLQDIRKTPLHMSVNPECFTTTINEWPVRSEIPLNLNELLVVEYYSNRILTFLKIYLGHILIKA